MAKKLVPQRKQAPKATTRQKVLQERPNPKRPTKTESVQHQMTNLVVPTRPLKSLMATLVRKPKRLFRKRRLSLKKKRKRRFLITKREEAQMELTTMK